MLDAYDRQNTITHLDDDARFEFTTPDVIWINTLAKDDSKPILITADGTIQKNPTERIALIESSLSIVFVKRSFLKLHFHQQAVKFLQIWPDLINSTGRCKVPTVFEMTAGARKIDRLMATSQLR